MADKHTPGPWLVEKAFPGVIVGGVMHEYAKGCRQDQIAMVCVVDPDNGGPVARAANARLMAAAPRMLEALRGVIRTADRDTIEFREARAAIAMATGETNG